MKTPPRLLQARALVARFFLLIVIILVAAHPETRAGTYGPQAFNYADGVLNLGDGTTVASSVGVLSTSVRSKTLQLMKVGYSNATASYKIPDLDLGKEIQAFDATLTAYIYRQSAAGVPGPGWSLSFGAIPTGNGSGDGGFVMTNGIYIAWDNFNNGGGDVPSVEVFCNGISVGNVAVTNSTDSPVATSGTFTLKNPQENATTAPIAYNATAADVQAAMRAIVGWEATVVTGNAAGPWTADRGVGGPYADLVDGEGELLVFPLTIQDGAGGLNERWVISVRPNVPRPVSIHWDAGGLDVTYNGTAIFTNLPTPGFGPTFGNSFAFSANNPSGATGDIFLDNVQFSTTPLPQIETGGPVITEFTAENATGYEDEDADRPDWIEIYNGQNATVNLGGWYLTDQAANRTLWQFPSVSLPPYGYLVVFASGKDRKPASGTLHTNFSLEKSGGYLALVRPDGQTIATEFTYGEQYEDISFGEKGLARTLGFLSPASPGARAKSADLQAPGGPAEEIVFSRPGGLITASTTLTIAPPVETGAVIRYTTNNTIPAENSSIYNPASPPAAFTFNATTTLRARVYTPDKLPGPVSSRTFLKVDTTLTNYASSGQQFSTNLPIVVMDSFGVPVDSFTTGGARPYRLTYAVVLAPDPVTGRTNITGPADFQGRSGTHVRGESSAGFPQRQYSWELWDNDNNDKDSSLLGLPSDSDWILYAPWSEKTLIRDHLVFSTMRKLRSDYMAPRTILCEVFFNQTAGATIGASSYRGVYLLKEKIKINSDRVDIAKLNNLTTDPARLTGGYIFRKDKPDADSTAITGAGQALLSNDPDVLTAPQLGALQSFLNTFGTALNGANFANPTTGYAAYIQPDTFIDAQWFVEWTKQIDGYVFSTYFHKDRGGKLRAGPIWDFNIAIGNADYGQGERADGWNYDAVGGNSQGVGQIWYPRLHQDPWYRLRHFDRYWDLRRSVLATASILADIDAHTALLLNGSTTAVTNGMPARPPLQENAVMRHYRKYTRLGAYDWPNPPGIAGDPGLPLLAQRTTYQIEVNYMRTWLSRRLAWLDEQFRVGTVIYRPPNLSHFGGNVAADQQLTISAYTGTPPAGTTYAPGSIYYTTNGSDPRGTNGAPAGILYSGPLAITSSRTVKARLHNGGNNWSPLSVAEFIVDAVPASATNLIVSELMYNPANATPAEIAAGFSSAKDFEFIELLNIGASNVDLTGVQFTDGVTFDFSVADPATLTLAPGARILVVANRNAFLFRYGNNPAVKIAGEYSGNFSNTGELVVLRAANGSVIQEFAYNVSEPWPEDADGGGYSFVRNNPSAASDPDAATSWRSSAQVGGTPGLANGVAFAGSPTGDTDGDGALDFFEYGTGSDLLSSGSKYGVVERIAPYVVGGVPGNYLEIEYRRNLAADGVNLRVELSEDMATWQTSAMTYVRTQNLGDGTALVTCRSTAPIDAAHPQMFVRLWVTP